MAHLGAADRIVPRSLFNLHKESTSPVTESLSKSSGLGNKGKLPVHI